MRTTLTCVIWQRDARGAMSGTRLPLLGLWHGQLKASQNCELHNLACSGRSTSSRTLRVPCGAHAIARRELWTNPKQDVQKTFYVQFHRALYYYTPRVLFERRFRNALAPLLNPLPALDWAPALLLLKRLNVHAALVILKTWVNSWCTSDRYHDGRFSDCIFGCSRDGSSDHLAHYLECPILWTITADAIRRPISADTLVRLCVRSPTKESSLSLLTAFTVYHDIKLGQPSLVDQALRRIDFQHRGAQRGVLCLSTARTFGRGPM